MSKRSAKRKLAIALAIVATVSVIGAGAFFVWASDYYRAQPEALAVLDEPGVTERGDLVVLEPDDPSGTALIFYPGAKVEATAYLPLLDKIRDQGIECILVKMPLNLAIFDANAADDVIAAFPDVETWYVGGHSMGGAMASQFASGHPSEVAGLILLGAYVYGDYPPAKALTVYGSFNDNLEDNIDYTDNIVVIEGGNHAQFGNYGQQAGDPDATISTESQQDQAVDAIMNFIGKE